MQQPTEHTAQSSTEQMQLQVAVETLDTLKSIERATKRQALFTTICASGTIITAILVIAAMIAGVIAYQKVQAEYAAFMQQIDAVSEQLNTINWQQMNDEFAGMLENIDGLVDESRSGITNATDALNDIDFSALNNAIADLQSVIKPLADFFNRF